MPEDAPAPNMRVIIEGRGDTQQVFMQADVLREKLLEAGLDIHSIRVEATRE